MFDRKVTWRLRIEMMEAKAFRTFIRVYSLFKSDRLSANINLTLHIIENSTSKRLINPITNPNPVLDTQISDNNYNLRVTINSLKPEI
jgi:hypothetical protein